MQVLVILSALSTLAVGALQGTTAGSSAALSHAASKSESKTGTTCPETTVTQVTGALQTVTQTLHRVELKPRHWAPQRGSPGPPHHRPTSAESAPDADYSISPIQWGPEIGHKSIAAKAGEYAADTTHDGPANTIHRRWNEPQGSPATKHHRPKPTHWGSREHPKPTFVKPEGYGSGPFPDEAPPALVHRRWEHPQGSSASKHPRPKPTHRGSKEHPKPTFIKPEGYGPGPFPDEAPPASLHRRWEHPQGSSASKHPRPKPTHRGSKEHSKPSTILEGYGTGLFSGETSSAQVHRRWKQPQGSPSHKSTESTTASLSPSSSTSASGTMPTKSSSLPASLPTTSVTSSIPTSSQSSIKSEKSTSSSQSNIESKTSASSSQSSTKSRTSTSTCTSTSPGATDTPAVYIDVLGSLTRQSCGLSNETVAKCPYLCYLGRGGITVGLCSTTDRSEFDSNFGPVSCNRCLPPCEQVSSTSFSVKKLVVSTTSLMSAVTSTACTTNSPFVGTIPSTKDKTTGALLRFECGLSFQLAYQCPYLCGHNVGEQLGTCYDQDNSTLAGNENNNTYTCTHCFYPSRKFTAPFINHTPTCTTKDPYNAPCPSSVRFDDSVPPVRYQTACGTTTQGIQDCPYLCTTVDKPDQYHCENTDVGGTIFKPAGTTQVCVKCLPEC